MIDVFRDAPGHSHLRLVLRPRRALSGRQVGVLFAVLSGTMWAVALLGAVFGNVYAPAFALLHSLIVAAALRWMWRLGERRESIDVDGTTVRVCRSHATDFSPQPERPVFEANPRWVRLSVGSAGSEPRVLLGSRGRQVEIGGFLAPDERKLLADRLQAALREASGRAIGAADDGQYQYRQDQDRFE
ncbi:MAG: DUF2244 domain-containing protein [Proteobacteria bacterium]|nr:DUF2244 domain-containing protein [Pseudomonadota bacterium]